MKRLDAMLRKAKEVDRSRYGVCILSEPISQTKLLQLRKRYEVIIIDDI